MAVPAQHRTRNEAGPFVLAAAIPLLFLHRRYQPSVSLGQVDVFLSDIAVLAVVVAGAWSVRERAEVFVRTRMIWAGLVAFAALIVLGTAWGSHYSGYPTTRHLITAAKWLEYMLLAPAVVAIVRSAKDLVPAAVVAVVWSVIATAIGVLQFFGLIADLDHTPAGGRKSSLLGYHDFSAFSAAVLVLALAALLTDQPRRRLAWVALGSACIGMVIGGAFDAVVGVLAAAVVLVLALHVREPRRVAIVAGALTLVVAGTFAIRSHAVADGLKFLGIEHGNGGSAQNVQSYRQRVLLAYIGGRIFLSHPATGVGWEGSSDAFAYTPYLRGARRRFSQPAVAFPSPTHPWGVQNAYVQALADLGVLGLAAFLAATLWPAIAALRGGVGLTRIVGAALVAVALGVWNGYGLVAGIPLDALTWLAVGVAISSVSFADNRLHDPHTGAV